MRLEEPVVGRDRPRPRALRVRDNVTLVLFLKDCPQRARGGEEVVVVRDRLELAERVQKPAVRGAPQQLRRRPEPSPSMR